MTADRSRGRPRQRRAAHSVGSLLVQVWMLAALISAIVGRWFVNGHWLTLHLLLLGAVSTAVLVFSQHFADTMTRTRAPGGDRSMTIRLALHTVGALAVILGLLTDLWPLLAIGASIVSLTMIAQALIINRQRRHAFGGMFADATRFYVMAPLLLPVAGFAGALMDFPTAAPTLVARAHTAHLALNLLGFVGLTVIGTATLLWPTALRTKSLSRRRDRTLTLTAMTFGIALVVVAAVIGRMPLVAFGLLIYLGGILVPLRAWWAEARTAPPQSFASWSLVGAYAWLVGIVLAGIMLYLRTESWVTVQALISASVTTFVVGYIIQILMGALSYLLPTLAGGGPAGNKAMLRVMNTAAGARIAALNLALLLTLPYAPHSLRQSAWIVATLCVATMFLSMYPAVKAGLRARRDQEERRAAEAKAGGRPATVDADKIRQETPTRLRRQIAPQHTLASAAAGVAVVALVMVGTLSFGSGGQGDQRSVLGAAPIQETGKITSARLTVKGMRFVPDVIEVPAGNRLEITLTNTGDDVHDLVLANGANSGRLAPGDSATIDAGVIKDKTDGWCSIIGHRQMGMVLTVKALGSTAGVAEGHDQAAHEATDPSSANSSAAADIDLEKKPAAGFKARSAELPAAQAGVVHRVTLKVQEVEREVAPGIRQKLWTFGGQAPGPTLRGRIGDRFEVTLVNDGSMGHSIDFHAGEMAPDGPMKTIQPGESLVYRFTATHAGIWMYHCSTAPMSVHIANGLFGAVIIDPPDLPAVDREYLLVQSELYLGPQGKSVDADKVSAQKPDLLVFNGYANQYVYRPLPAKVGERVRFWVLDAGPNRPWSFHVVGAQFDSVWFEGDYRLRPGSPGGSQTLGMQAAQGGFVETVFKQAGHYSAVNHIMSDAERGATGIIEVTN